VAISWDDVRDLEQDYRDAEPEETEDEARARMLPAEREADLEYQALVERRAQPLKERGKRAQWGTWRKRKAGVVARRQRAGR
jgi:hypothetical protein